MSTELVSDACVTALVVPPAQIGLARLGDIVQGVLEAAKVSLIEEIGDSFDGWSPAQQKALIADKAMQRLEMTSSLSHLVAAEIADMVETGKLWAWHPNPEESMAAWVAKRGGSALYDGMAILTIIAPVAEKALGWSLSQMMDPGFMGFSRLREICPRARKADASLEGEEKELEILRLLDIAKDGESVREVRRQVSETPEIRIPFPTFETAANGTRSVTFENLTDEQWAFIEKRLSRHFE
jgi:hypothetical protein